MKVKILEGAKAIETAIKSISGRGKKLEADIHQAAYSCLVHADKHGDVTLATKLLDAIPGLARKNALRDWFIAFGKFGYDSKEKVMTFDKKKQSLLKEAAETPFWEFKPEPDYKPFDIMQAVQAVLQRAEKAIAKGEKVPEKALKALRQVTEFQPAH